MTEGNFAVYPKVDFWNILQILQGLSGYATLAPDLSGQ